MISLWIIQVTISSSQKRLSLNSVKIQRNVCFLTQTFDFWKIFPEYNLYREMLRSIYLSMP